MYDNFSNTHITFGSVLSSVWSSDHGGTTGEIMEKVWVSGGGKCLLQIWCLLEVFLKHTHKPGHFMFLNVVSRDKFRTDSPELSQSQQ